MSYQIISTVIEYLRKNLILMLALPAPLLACYIMICYFYSALPQGYVTTANIRVNNNSGIHSFKRFSDEFLRGGRRRHEPGSTEVLPAREMME